MLQKSRARRLAYREDSTQIEPERYQQDREHKPVQAEKRDQGQTRNLRRLTD
jgi:hypothetical protein